MSETAFEAAITSSTFALIKLINFLLVFGICVEQHQESCFLGVSKTCEMFS